MRESATSPAIGEKVTGDIHTARWLALTVIHGMPGICTLYKVRCLTQTRSIPPILFLHGTADTNVPIGESIQMFTALKLLGKPTAFVQVEGENHHILDYDKRILWNNTIYAWFAKWLKDQPEWWDALYPPKSL